MENRYTIYCNQLRWNNHPEDYVLSFRDIFNQNIYALRQAQDPKCKIKKVFIMTKNFDLELVKPFLALNVQVFIVADNQKQDSLTGMFKKYQGHENLNVLFVRCQGNFHPKLWLIQFEDCLRIVVGTGNFEIPHWTHWSNLLTLNDFKYGYQEQSNQIKNQDFNFDLDYQTTLKNFIQNILKYQEQNFIELDHYSLNGIENKVLIPSMDGKYSGDLVNQYGMMKVREILLKFPPISKGRYFNSPVLTVQSSSLGVLGSTFLEEILACFMPFTFSLDNLRDMRKKGLKSPEDIFKKHIKIIYPSRKYIFEQTHEGVFYSNVLHYSQKNYEDKKCHNELLYDYTPNGLTNHGVYPHHKVWIITDNDYEINDDTIIYMGSHNFTQYAWGKLEQDFKSIHLANTELGVLYPSFPKSGAYKQQIIRQLPFQFPCKQYLQGDRPFVATLDFKLIE